MNEAPEKSSDPGRPLAPNINSSNDAGDLEATAPPPPDALAYFSRVLRRQTATSVAEDREPFMGVKVWRTSLHREYKGDYLNVPSNPYVMKILEKQGDRQGLFADNILKFTGSGKIKRRILLITDLAIYILDLDASLLKRRVDCLLASTRKTEIVTVLVEATKNNSDYGIEVVFSNRFKYYAAADNIKEVQFEEVDGGVRTRIVKKSAI
ncbi:hypothetical protein AMTRI_Chr08g205930 [Amborella trichopoda]